MKTRILITALCAAGLLAAAGTASAGGTAKLDVAVKVNGTCKFTDATGTINFGELSADAGAQSVTSTGDILFWCSKKATYTITDDLGGHKLGTQRRMVHVTDGSEFLPYGLTYIATGTGGGPASSVSLDVTADISAADLLSAAAGDFADTVTFTITP